MPPVENADAVTMKPFTSALLTLKPLRNSGIMQAIVPTTTMTAASRRMKRDVCLISGMTCPERASARYSEAAAAPVPKMPSASAMTTTPMPPMRCMIARHSARLRAMWSVSSASDMPVVVNAETVSNIASR